MKIAVLVMLLFLSSTILIAAKANISFSDQFGDGGLAATSTTMVYVDPQNTTKNVNETFTIDIVIADVTNLYGVDIQFEWDPAILEYVSHTAKIPVEDYSDGILHKPGIPIMNDVDVTAGTYALAYACMVPAPVFNGTGTAFNMTFKVKKTGGCGLSLFFIQLADQNGWPIDYDKQDGYFETPGTPTASFTWQPQIGVVGKPISFDASGSSAPGGTIVKYHWDFDDGNTTASTSAEITHAFNHSDDTKTYSVSLNVENDAHVNSSSTVEQVIIVKSRNIKIELIWLSTSLTIVNSTVQANVTVANTGYTTENSTLTAYYNTSTTEWTKIAATNVTNLKSEYIKIYSFNWNTTGVEAEKYYVIKANATAVPYGNESDNTKISEPLYIISEAIHDLAVESLMLQASYGGDEFAVPVIFGESALFTISIENQGSVPEQSYYVAVYSNGSLLNDWNMTEALDAGATNTLTYTWNNISQHGRYNITAQVTITTDDNNTQNNQLQQMLRVIGTPILNITYTPETLVVNQIIVLNASGSVHGDPEGQLTAYYWEIYAPRQMVGLDLPKYQSVDSEISVSYTFTEEGDWTIVLRVTDNYGITYVGTRTLTADYRQVTEVPVVTEFSSTMILLLAMVFTTLTAIITKKRLPRKTKDFNKLHAR